MNIFKYRFSRALHHHLRNGITVPASQELPWLPPFPANLQLPYRISPPFANPKT